MLRRDIVIVNRAAYDFSLPYSGVRLFHTGSPRRGDMVLARLPDGQIAIKGVLGLPGETIELRENRVSTSGRPLPQSPAGIDFCGFPRACNFGAPARSRWVNAEQTEEVKKRSRGPVLRPSNRFRPASQ